MKERNCINCFNLKAKIPLVNIKARTKWRTFRDIGLNWTKAQATCTAGMFVQDGDKEEIKDKVFPNLFRKVYRPRVFVAAQNCPYYEGEDGE